MYKNRLLLKITICIISNIFGGVLFHPNLYDIHILVCLRQYLAVIIGYRSGTLEQEPTQNMGVDSYLGKKALINVYM